MDTYFRGNSHELEFCRDAGAGGNHLVVTTASGQSLGKEEGGPLKLREEDLAPLLARYRKLPGSVRKPALPDPADAEPPRRPVPEPPENGLVIRAYCTYLDRDEEGKPQRAKRFYYQQNPDAWAAETQSDMLWLTESEWQALIPETWSPGATAPVSPEIQRRFFSTIGIDYMEGSVQALPVREATMTLTVEEEGVLRLTGHGKMGQAFQENAASEGHSRGCELRVIGTIKYDTAQKKIITFDLAGVGEAWGHQRDDTRREITLPSPRWSYGIACELVPGNTPDQLLPPYNLLHYGGKMDYFGD